jgi:hypothetical protein
MRGELLYTTKAARTEGLQGQHRPTQANTGQHKGRIMLLRYTRQPTPPHYAAMLRAAGQNTPAAHVERSLHALQRQLGFCPAVQLTGCPAGQAGAHSAPAPAGVIRRAQELAGSEGAAHKAPPLASASAHARGGPAASPTQSPHAPPECQWAWPLEGGLKMRMGCRIKRLRMQRCKQLCTHAARAYKAISLVVYALMRPFRQRSALGSPRALPCFGAFKPSLWRRCRPANLTRPHFAMCMPPHSGGACQMLQPGGMPLYDQNLAMV